MNIFDEIRQIFRRGNSVLIDNRAMSYFCNFERRDYSSLVWLNICDLLTDLINDVELVRKSGDTFVFALWKRFVEVWGKIAMQQLFDDGFCVVGYDGSKFWIMNANEYRVITQMNEDVVEPVNKLNQVYVLRSTTFVNKKVSDKAMCKPWLDYIDDVMSGSANIAKRLGVVLVTSPKTASASPVPVVLTEEQKKDIETSLQKDYGMLNKQNNVMLLPRDMNMQIVNLAGQDVRMSEKCRHAILAICDRIKVPANQVAIIDANSSKSLSNGSELREGDRNKYQSFERLFQQTFIVMAQNIGLDVTYSIYNKPTQQITTTEIDNEGNF